MAVSTNVNKCKVMHLGVGNLTKLRTRCHTAKESLLSWKRPQSKEIWVIEISILSSSCSEQSKSSVRAHQKTHFIPGLSTGETIITALMRPHLEYSNVVCHTQYKK